MSEDLCRVYEGSYFKEEYNEEGEECGYWETTKVLFFDFKSLIDLLENASIVFSILDSPYENGSDMAASIKDNDVNYLDIKQKTLSLPTYKDIYDGPYRWVNISISSLVYFFLKGGSDA